jgi:hypothetical protein
MNVQCHKSNTESVGLNQELRGKKPASGLCSVRNSLILLIYWKEGERNYSLTETDARELALYKYMFNHIKCLDINIVRSSPTVGAARLTSISKFMPP